jgi:predicted transcriptional regulator
MQVNASPVVERSRVSVDVSPTVASLLDHISEVTGVPRAQIVNTALLDALPVVLARADALKKRQSELSAAARKK